MAPLGAAGQAGGAGGGVSGLSWRRTVGLSFCSVFLFTSVNFLWFHSLLSARLAEMLAADAGAEMGDFNPVLGWGPSLSILRAAAAKRRLSSLYSSSSSHDTARARGGRGGGPGVRREWATQPFQLRLHAVLSSCAPPPEARRFLDLLAWGVDYDNDTVPLVLILHVPPSCPGATPQATKELVQSAEAAAEAFQWPWGPLSRVRAEGKGDAGGEAATSSAGGAAAGGSTEGTPWERRVRAVDASGFSLLSLWRPDLAIRLQQQQAAGTGAGAGAGAATGAGAGAGAGTGSGAGVGAGAEEAAFSEREHGFFVRSSVEMSPLLYRYLRSYALSYADFRGEGDPEIFGINALDISPPAKAQTTSPSAPAPSAKWYLRQRLGFNCQLMLPGAWGEFWAWRAHFLTFSAEAQELAQRKQRGIKFRNFDAACAHSPQQSFLALSHNRNLFNLYAPAVPPPPWTALASALALAAAPGNATTLALPTLASSPSSSSLGVPPTPLGGSGAGGLGGGRSLCVTRPSSRSKLTPHSLPKATPPPTDPTLLSAAQQSTGTRAGDSTGTGAGDSTGTGAGDTTGAGAGVQTQLTGAAAIRRLLAVEEPGTLGRRGLLQGGEEGGEDAGSDAGVVVLEGEGAEATQASGEGQEAAGGVQAQAQAEEKAQAQAQPQAQAQGQAQGQSLVQTQGQEQEQGEAEGEVQVEGEGEEGGAEGGRTGEAGAEAGDDVVVLEGAPGASSNHEGTPQRRQSQGRFQENPGARLVVPPPHVAPPTEEREVEAWDPNPHRRKKLPPPFFAGLLARARGGGRRKGRKPPPYMATFGALTDSASLVTMSWNHEREDAAPVGAELARRARGAPSPLLRQHLPLDPRLLLSSALSSAAGHPLGTPGGGSRTGGSGGGSGWASGAGTEREIADEVAASELGLASDGLQRLAKSDCCGSHMTDGYYAHDRPGLARMLARLHVKRSVVAVMTSVGFEDMLENWLCFVNELQIRNFFIITTSKRQAVDLAARGIAAFVLQGPRDLPLPGSGAAFGRKDARERARHAHLFSAAAASTNNGSGGVSAVSVDYGSIGYKQLILERTKRVGDILQLGYHVLLADVDAVWLSNPFAHFQDPTVGIYAQLEASGAFCGGFLYLRSMPAVMQLWTKVTEAYERVVQKMVHEAPNVSPENFAEWLKGHEHLHEQRYLNQYVSSHEEPDLVTRGLDPLLFPNGRDYFVRRKAQHAGVTPVVIHNNYIKGKANKTRRFRESGLWRLDPSGRYCACFVCRLQQQSRKKKGKGKGP